MQVFKFLPRVGSFCSACTLMMATVVAATGVPRSAGAVTVDVFLVSGQTAPTSSTAALSFTTTTVYQLDLNSSGIATTAKLVDDFTFNATEALTFNNQSVISDSIGPIDSVPGTYDRSVDPLYAEYESGAGTAGYVNSEVGVWDDAFIDSSGADNASLNLDMHRNSWVTFNSLAAGFTELVIAEVGALTPLALSLCPDTLCTTATTIFTRFSSSLASALVSMPDFTNNEAGASQGELDQTFVFRFSEPIYDYVRITEVGNRSLFSGERLEIDYIGAGSTGTLATDPVSAVPLPASFPLLLAGLGLVGWVSRRKGT